jgi:hypothetical protein
VMSVTYGEKSSEYYGRRNQHGSWERTFQDSLLLSEDNSSDVSSMTWSRWGIALDGVVTELRMSEQFTKETGSSSLPTPRANNAMATNLTSENLRNHPHPNLEVVIARQMLPTPRASQDHKPIQPLAPSEANGTHGKTLVADIGNQLLPTPTVQDAKNNGSESQQKRNTKPLNAVAINLSLEETGNNGESPLRLGLNPEFVEAMMGFPIGWTSIEPND